MNDLEKLISNQQFGNESLGPIILNFLLCLIFVNLVGWFYKRHAVSLGGKTHVGAILPLIGLTVFLVIVVVKGSLALSLGLVGALSIVRFRTPIKEPEELGYLFLVIAIGLGFGAGLEIVTSSITLAILCFLYVGTRHNRSHQQFGEYTVALTIKTEKFDKACDVIANNAEASKIIRVEHEEIQTSICYNIAASSGFNSKKIMDELLALDRDAKLDLVEAGVNW